MEEYFSLKAYPAHGKSRHGGRRDGAGGGARSPEEND